MPQGPQFRLFTLKSLESLLRGWVFLAISVLLVVWALPHTIAARNIAIFSGLLASLVWVAVAKPSLKGGIWSSFWPSICLFAIPLWVLLHYFTISELKEPQWQELSSTWLRTSAVVVMGSIAGLMLARRPTQILWVILGICLLPTITCILYLQQVHIQGAWVLPSGMFYGPYKGKFSEVYFVICQVLVGFALLVFVLQQGQKNRFWPLLAAITLILMGVADFIGARGANGIIVTGLGIVVTLLALIGHSLLDQKRTLRQRAKLAVIALLALSILSTALYSFWLYDQRYEGKLVNLVGDIQISSQIDRSEAWARDGRGLPNPVDRAGRAVNSSTYERVSWFLKGVELIKEYPLGNGISHKAFGYYMREEFPGSMAPMTHSAWVDFTLGMGLPGLLLAWTAIFAVVWRAIRRLGQPNWINLDPQGNITSSRMLTPIMALYLLVGLFCFWIIGEVSEREYLEHYFFLIALFGGVMPPQNQQTLAI